MLESGKRKGSAMNIEIAQRLYELRRKHGFSQESLAAELGLSRQAISKWERSESAPDMGNLIALADLYGMTIDELIRPSDNEGNESTDTGESSEANMETTDVAESGEPTPAPEPAFEAEPMPTSETAPVPEPVSVSELAPTPAPEPMPAPQPHHLYKTPDDQPQKPRCALRKFPYPLLVTILFLLFGIIFADWSFIWLFLTIPFYYWIALVIEKDPIFLTTHGYTSDPSQESSNHTSTNMNSEGIE